MTDKIHPRSPYLRLGGYVHLARLIDKARLHRQGLLHGYNYKTFGFDRHLLNFLGVPGDVFEEVACRSTTDEEVLAWLRVHAVAHSDEEMEAWNQTMLAKSPDTPEKLARFRHILTEIGGAEYQADVQTYFELIDFEERRAAFLESRLLRS